MYFLISIFPLSPIGNTLVNVDPHLPPPQGNMGHRWGIHRDLFIEQAPGDGGLANFVFVIL